MYLVDVKFCGSVDNRLLLLALAYVQPLCLNMIEGFVSIED